LEVKNLKEETIARILLEQDKAVLAQIAKAIHQIQNPGRPGNIGGVTAVEGNG
jgi:hypothetical protein